MFDMIPSPTVALSPFDLIAYIPKLTGNHIIDSIIKDGVDSGIRLDVEVLNRYYQVNRSVSVKFLLCNQCPRAGNDHRKNRME